MCFAAYTTPKNTKCSGRLVPRMKENVLLPVERRSTTAAMIWMGSRLSPASITDRQKTSKIVGLFVFRYGSNPRIPFNCFRCFMRYNGSLY